ncbi:TetR/AcrR family transcriptional regulator [Streptomyces albicerus]|uniref:TetR/AcrR family transcriptional regulator n=1 Tax=Streptomyces albicerus TaxID=2569859 RepID=UPI00124B03ED|nr:TetR/AcrR family transcriptional regulator [Streptomyces albicerus]
MSVPTRTRILDAAWDLFLREGFAGTTVTQIEASAGLSAGSGSFYRHFRSKKEVLQAVVDREVERTNAERQTGPEPEETGGDVRVALALEFERRLGNLRRLHPLMELVARERDHLGASVDHLGELLVARNVSIRSQRLAGWMAAGAILTRDAEALAAVITFALTGYHLSVRFFGHPPAGVSEEALITTLVDLVAGV